MLGQIGCQSKAWPHFEPQYSLVIWPLKLFGVYLTDHSWSSPVLNNTKPPSFYPLFTLRIVDCLMGVGPTDLQSGPKGAWGAVADFQGGESQLPGTGLLEEGGGVLPQPINPREGPSLCLGQPSPGSQGRMRMHVNQQKIPWFAFPKSHEKSKTFYSALRLYFVIVFENIFDDETVDILVFSAQPRAQRLPI